MTIRTTLAAGTAILALAAPALADTATVATDLNLRAGPGPNYAISTTMPAEAEVDLVGCVEGGQWCEVTYEGTTGFAYAPYLAITEEDALVTVDQATVTTIETVTFDEENGEEALIGGAVGAGLASAAIGGPAAIAGGILLGSLAGTAAAPEETTIAYVQENPVDPIFIQGEAVLGADIPDGVELIEIPGSDYAYLNLNGENVLIDPSDRTIVFIDR